MVLERKLRPIGPYKLLGKVVYGFKRGSKQVRRAISATYLGDLLGDLFGDLSRRLLSATYLGYVSRLHISARSRCDLGRSTRAVQSSPCTT